MTILNKTIKDLLTNKRAFLYVLLAFGLFTGIQMLQGYFIIAILATMVGFVVAKAHDILDLTLKRTMEYKTILDSYNNMILIVDDDKVINANSRCMDFFDIPKNHNDELHSKLMDSVIAPILSTRIDHRIEITDDIGNTKIFTVHPKKLSIHNDKKYMIELVDITEHVQEKNALEDNASRDQLTGLYNRRFFNNHVIKKSKHLRSTDNLSVVIFDIDNFKSINDTYGHRMGDDVLVFLANTVKTNIRDTDIFCRWGGEEFLILTPNSIENAIKMAENIRKVIDEHSKNTESIPHITCSFGVAEIKPDRSYMPTIDDADKLLYKSKTTGKNKVSY